MRKSRILQVESNDSGWGSSHVPVLAMNDYDLLSGEPSAWGRETKKVAAAPTKKKEAVKFKHQDFCQSCGDGGLLIECPRCPISIHGQCCGLSPHEFSHCSHHNCVVCEKSNSSAGGLIYCCQSCPRSWCPDCLPGEPYRYLGHSIPRFEKLGFHGNQRYFYIHCSQQCEEVAKVEFNFKPNEKKYKSPKDMDVSYAFGKDAMDIKEMVRMFKLKANGIQLPPAHPAGSRVSPRKRSPKAPPAAAGKPGLVQYGEAIIDLTESSHSSQTGYI